MKIKTHHFSAEAKAKYSRQRPLYGPELWPNHANARVDYAVGFTAYISLTLSDGQPYEFSSQPIAVQVFRLHVHLENLAEQEWGRGNDRDWASKSLKAKAILESGVPLPSHVFLPSGWPSYYHVQA